MNYRRPICIMLSVLLIAFSLPFSISAYTEEAELIGIEYPILYEKSQSDILTDELLEKLDEDAFEEHFLAKIANVPSSIDISGFNISASDNQALSQYIWYHMPEAFNVYGLGYSTFGGRIYTVSLTYRDFADTPEEFSVCREAFYEGANKLLDGIKGNDTLSDVEKALLLHDRLAATCEYDYTSGSSARYTAYGAFGRNAAVCQGYTMAYMYLLDEVGIESGYCSSEEMNHAWNIVYIDGEPYHTDVTWDDIAWKSGENGAVGRIEHENFLRSTEGIVSTGHDGADFDTEPDSVVYDNYYWQNSETEFVLLSDGIYYIDSNSAKILKTDDSSFSLSVSDRWKPSLNSAWSGNYACLDSSDDILLYSLTDAVYAYDTKTAETTEIYAPELEDYKSIYGFTYDDGNLVLDICQGPPYSSYATERYRETVPYSFGCTHSFEKIAEDEYLVSSADCVNAAVYCLSCSLCGEVSDETFTYGAADPDNHLNTESIGMVEATCTAVGYTEGVYCNDCKKYISGHEEIALNENAHIWDEGAETTKGTCVNTSVITYTCIHNPLHTRTENGSTDANNHVNTENVGMVEATCTETGYTAGVYCNDCEKYISGHEEIALNENAHIWDEGTETTKGTCVNTSVITYTCIYNPLHTRTENGSTDARNHVNTVNVPAKKATCTETGYTAGVYCNDCEKYISGHEEIGIDETAHSWDEGTETTKGTCVNTSVITYTCIHNPLHTRTENGSIDANNHVDTVNLTEKKPTCTEVGYTSGLYCNDCNKIISGREEVAIIPHTFTVTVVPATCYEKGYTFHLCSHCGYEYYDTFTEKTEHNDSDNDSLCDVCHNDLSIKEDCSHMCHKDGFMGFIWKVINFFSKLFGMNPVCECGKAHY